MRILITHPSRTTRGGIFNATLIHAIGLKAVGHEVVIATGSETLEPVANKYDIPVLFDVKLSEPLGPVYSLSLNRKLRKLGGFDAVIHQGGKSWFWARLFFPRAQHSVVFHNSKLGLRKFFNNWLVLSSAQSDVLQKLKGSFSRRQIEQIKNGFFPVANTSHQERHIRGDAPVRIGSVAEMRKVKGFGILVESFHELRKRGHNIELVLGGDGSELPKLKKRVQELGLESCVKFPGWFEDVSKFYEMIDVFCLPSLDEPFGLVVLEAMSAGLPVIATRTFGPIDLITDGKNGLLVNVGDKHDLSLSMQNFLSMGQEERLGMIAAGKYHADENYGFEAIGRSLEDAIYRFATPRSLFSFGRTIKKPG